MPLPLASILDAAPDFDSAWQGAYKIPWDEPGFSRRMLREHLSQEHDLASRKREIVGRQVEWINERFSGGRPLAVLDVGCGPGLYAAGLVAAGHRYQGIDFSPASIDYAGEHNPDPTRCRFVHGDVRAGGFGDGYDLAMMLYGELNVFSPDECRAILAAIHAALTPGGRLLIELQSAGTVEQTGTAAATWYKTASGLFSDRPHICLIENHWDGQRRTAMQLFHVIDLETAEVNQYRNTTQAWPEEAFRELLTDANFDQIETEHDWPQPGEVLTLYSARRP